MIGLIRGRVYYNLGSWYRVLALLPGYRLNAGLMEGMMGVRDGIPDALRPEPPSTGRIADAAALLRTVVGLVVAHVRLPRMRRDFFARVDDALRRHGAETEGMSLDDLAEAYSALDATLLKRWDAPLVNDFFAMIWFGLAQRAAEGWVGPGALGGLLAGDGDVVSAEPARRVETMARASADDPAWVETLLTADRSTLAAGLAERPPMAADVAAYVARFGDRCLEELKLESPTLADDPTPLFRSVGARARRIADGDAREPGVEAARQRAEAETGRPTRSAVTRSAGFCSASCSGTPAPASATARTSASSGRACSAAPAASSSPWASGSPRRADSTTPATCSGSRSTNSWGWRGGPRRRSTRVASRPSAGPSSRATATARPRRIGSRRAGRSRPPRSRRPRRRSPSPAATSAPASGAARAWWRAPSASSATRAAWSWHRGRSSSPSGPIPGGCLLFPACAGLIVERGSLLSHSAIVARELGIPAAVAVPGVTSWLRDGDRVRLDGATGRVERIDE